MTVLEVLRRTEGFLRDKGVPTAQLDAQLLLAQALGMDRLQVFMNFDRPMSDEELAAARPLVKRRVEGESIAYILGEKEFWSLDFAVGPGVLVPRPETELLVEKTLELIDEGEELFVADICAGSGCVGISIASERPGVRVYATELSAEALPWLKQNVEAHDMKSRVAVLGGDLLAPIPDGRQVDIVVSNPPYIAKGQLASLAVAKHEPAMALDGGQSGLDVYRRLIPEALRRARRAVLVEIGHDQGETVSALFRSAGAEAVVHKDLAGHDRVVAARVRD
jgi:release factor glutamine methyltransferase